MTGTAHAAWLKATPDAWSPSAEAATVARLRITKVTTGGPAAATEASLMTAQNVQAGFELQASLVASGLGLTPLAGTQKALRLDCRKVAANRRRLTR